MAARVGTGTTITFSSNDPAFEVLSFSAGDATVPVIDISHMGTTGSRAKTTGDLIDEGDVTVECHLDPNTGDTAHSALGTSQTITIQVPAITGETTGAKISGTGAVTALNWSVPMEDKMLASYTFTWLGAVTWTDATT